MTRTPNRTRWPLNKFTYRFQSHDMSEMAVRNWVTERLKRDPPQFILGWIDTEEAEAARALDVLSKMFSTRHVRRAVGNAKQHRAWLRLVRAAMGPHAPPRRRRAVRRRSRGSRVGLLAREAQSYRAKGQ